MQGLAPEQIGQMLRLGTGDIGRLRRLLERDPGATCVRPSILIYRRWLGEITTADLMAALRIWPYTPSVYAPYPAEGMVPGSWHEVQLAYRDRYLSREEFDSLRTLAPQDLTAQLVAPPDTRVRDRVVPSQTPYATTSPSGTE